MELKGSKTAENLMKSFINESQASMRYTYYAGQAKKDGYVQIQNIFLETARNEEQHAKRFYKFLRDVMQGETVDICGNFPIEFGETLDNLKAAAYGEEEEYTTLYPEFAKIAKEEGFNEIAAVFKNIGEVEKAHFNRYKKLIENIEEGKVFKRDGVYIWKCDNCGYLHEGKTAPKVCPACDHPQAHFELFVENY
ncbi:MAG: rubrerythrin family protein [Ezakiella sp.]|nr:rubrerythrin family protein [Ezakiella sp.]MDY3946698.1 rubrerythrin family protein [Ezakiella sp.]